jgi:O-antigen/teichoic acid export membrane protein
MKVASGNVVVVAFNFVALALLSACLDPGPRDLFGSMMAAMALIASLADFGLGTSIVKYYREIEQEDGVATQAEALLRRVFGWRLIVAAAMACAAALLARPICRLWLHDDGPAGLFRWICLGGFGATLWMFCQASMQARGQFGRYGFQTAANHALRLAAIAALAWWGGLTVGAAVAVAVAVPFVGAAAASMGWTSVFWRSQMPPDRLRARQRELFRFSKWILMSTAIVSVLMRLDIFLIGALTNQAQVGLFDTANSMAQGVPLLTAALSTVLLPRLAATRRRDEMLRVARQFLRVLPFALIGVVLAGLAAHLLIPLLRHGQYNGSAAIFDVLVCAYVLTILGSPISFFCLAFERASWLTWMNLAQLILNIGLSLLFIPRLGGMGGALAILGVRLFAIAYLIVAFRRLLAMAQPGAAQNAQ